MSGADIREDVFPSDEDFDEDDDDTDSSTDVEAKLAEDDVFDVEFLKCYSALKKKDDKIYDKNVRFFTSQDSSSESGDEEKERRAVNRDDLPDSRYKTNKPKLTLLDLQLDLAKGEPEELEAGQHKIDLNQEVSKSYYEKELEEIKKSIEKVSENFDSDTDDELLVVKGSEGKERPSEQRKNEIKTILDRIEDDEDGDIRHLRQVWTDPEQLSEEDKYLRDYILNKRYLPTNTEDDDDDNEDGFFSKNLEHMSDADDSEDGDVHKSSSSGVLHHSDEKNFDKIVRIPRNSTKTIRDMIEKQEKKEKRLKKIDKKKKRKKALKDADCEDIVGDLPTKFQYRETEPNDFGLTAEELLMATDEELDKWVSLHECVAYKSKEAEIAQKQHFDSKRHDIELKRKIFKSVYGDGEASNQPAEKDTSKKKRKRKRKRADSESSSVAGVAEPNSPDEKDKSVLDEKKRNKKRRIRGIKQKRFASVGVAPDRLLAYGLSKTKLKREKLL